MRPRERNERHLHQRPCRQGVHRQADAVHGDRAVRDRYVPHLARHPHVVQPRVAVLLHPLHHRAAVHVSLHQMAAEAIRRSHRALEVHRAARRVFAEQRAIPRRVDHVHRERAFRDALDGETGPVHGDALATLHPLEGGADHERKPPVLGGLRHAPYGAHDSGKHSRLSKTSNVSGPNALRSTGVQRGAAATRRGGTPGKAGIAPSPSHTAPWTQYSRSTNSSARSLAPSAPPPSHNSARIPAVRSSCSPSAHHLQRNTRTPFSSPTHTSDPAPPRPPTPPPPTSP